MIYDIQKNIVIVCVYWLEFTHFTISEYCTDKLSFSTFRDFELTQNFLEAISRTKYLGLFDPKIYNMFSIPDCCLRNCSLDDRRHLPPGRALRHCPPPRGLDLRGWGSRGRTLRRTRGWGRRTRRSAAQDGHYFWNSRLAF